MAKTESVISAFARYGYGQKCNFIGGVFDTLWTIMVILYASNINFGTK